MVCGGTFSTSVNSLFYAELLFVVKGLNDAAKQELMKIDAYVLHLSKKSQSII
jgi:hypothetical protein